MHVLKFFLKTFFLVSAVIAGIFSLIYRDELLLRFKPFLLKDQALAFILGRFFSEELLPSLAHPTHKVQSASTGSDSADTFVKDFLPLSTSEKSRLDSPPVSLDEQKSDTVISKSSRELSERNGTDISSEEEDGLKRDNPNVTVLDNASAFEHNSTLSPPEFSKPADSSEIRTSSKEIDVPYQSTHSTTKDRIASFQPLSETTNDVSVPPDKLSTAIQETNDDRTNDDTDLTKTYADKGIEPYLDLDTGGNTILSYPSPPALSSHHTLATEEKDEVTLQLSNNLELANTKPSVSSPSDSQEVAVQQEATPQRDATTTGNILPHFPSYPLQPNYRSGNGSERNILPRSETEEQISSVGSSTTTAPASPAVVQSNTELQRVGQENLYSLTNRTTNTLSLPLDSDQSQAISHLIEEIQPPLLPLPETDASPKGEQSNNLALPLRENWGLARQLFWQQNFLAAEKAYQMLIYEYPDEPDLPGELGNIYLSQGRWQEAIQLYHEAGLRALHTVDRGRIWSVIRILHYLDPNKAEILRQSILSRITRP